MEIFLGSHQFLLIMKHTPPPLFFPASAVLSIRKTEKLSDRGCRSVRDRGREPCFSQTKDVTVPNVPLETNHGSKILFSKDWSSNWSAWLSAQKEASSKVYAQESPQTVC